MLKSNSRLRQALGEARGDALVSAVRAMGDLLPHLLVVASTQTAWHMPGAEWIDKRRTSVRVYLGPSSAATGGGYCLAVDVERLVPRTFKGSETPKIDMRELALCSAYADAVAEVLDVETDTDHVYDAMLSRLDERAVALHLAEYHGLRFDVGTLLMDLHRLSEQTYENKSIAFGCLIDGKLPYKKDIDSILFTAEFLQSKKYRALSDGYKTSYVLSRAGRLRGFGLLAHYNRHHETVAGAWFPSWGEDMAVASAVRSGVGLCLTRQGDLLVFDNGGLTFGYRNGRWQYWNHAHIVQMLTAMCRRQKVKPKSVRTLVEFVYGVALDISFRRTGGLLIVLRNRNLLRKCVRLGDAIDDARRGHLDADFDVVLAANSAGDRETVAELAGLDGATVFDGTSRIMAYGAILKPVKSGRVRAEEGSRTKAAIGTSHYGLALKISSDGDMTAYYDGSEMFRI